MAMNPPVVDEARLDADSLDFAQLLAHGLHLAISGLLLLLHLLEVVEDIGELPEHGFQRLLDVLDVLDDGLHRGGFSGRRFGRGGFSGFGHGFGFLRLGLRWVVHRRVAAGLRVGSGTVGGWLLRGRRLGWQNGTHDHAPATLMELDRLEFVLDLHGGQAKAQALTGVTMTVFTLTHGAFTHVRLTHM